MPRVEGPGRHGNHARSKIALRAVPIDRRLALESCRPATNDWPRSSGKRIPIRMRQPPQSIPSARFTAKMGLTCEHENRRTTLRVVNFPNRASTRRVERPFAIARRKGMSNGSREENLDRNVAWPAGGPSIDERSESPLPKVASNQGEPTLLILANFTMLPCSKITRSSTFVNH